MPKSRFHIFFLLSLILVTSLRAENTDRALLAKEAHDIETHGSDSSTAVVGALFGRGVGLLVSSDPVQREQGNILLGKYLDDEMRQKGAYESAAAQNMAQYRLETAPLEKSASADVPTEDQTSAEPKLTSEQQAALSQFQGELAKDGRDSRLGMRGISSDAVAESLARGNVDEMRLLLGMKPTELTESDRRRAADEAKLVYAGIRKETLVFDDSVSGNDAASRLPASPVMRTGTEPVGGPASAPAAVDFLRTPEIMKAHLGVAEDKSGALSPEQQAIFRASGVLATKRGQNIFMIARFSYRMWSQ